MVVNHLEALLSKGLQEQNPDITGALSAVQRAKAAAIDSLPETVREKAAGMFQQHAASMNVSFDELHTHVTSPDAQNALNLAQDLKAAASKLAPAKKGIERA